MVRDQPLGMVPDVPSLISRGSYLKVPYTESLPTPRNPQKEDKKGKEGAGGKLGKSKEGGFGSQKFVSEEQTGGIPNHLCG